MVTATTTCMSGLLSTINVNGLVSKVSLYQSQNLVDDVSNLKNDYVYIFSGTLDNTVKNSIKFLFKFILLSIY